MANGDDHKTLFPPRVGCCVFASQPQLISDVVWFVTVTLTGIREHQRQILHFPTAYGVDDSKFPPPLTPLSIAPPGQPIGLTARRLAALSRTETPGAPRQRPGLSGISESAVRHQRS